MLYSRQQSRRSGADNGGGMGQIADILIAVGLIVAVITWIPHGIAYVLDRDVSHPSWYWEQAIAQECTGATYTYPNSDFTYNPANDAQRTQCEQMRMAGIDITDLFYVGWQNVQFAVFIIALLAGMGGFALRLHN